MPFDALSRALAATFPEKDSTLVLIRSSGDVRRPHGPAAAAETRYAPCSTFKMVLGLLALEARLIPDADTLRRWRGPESGREEWDRDQTLRSALQTSTEWYFAELARELGQKQLRASLARLGYAADWRGTDPALAWHDGTLRLNAVEMARFTRRLADDALPLDRKVQALVRDCLRVEGTGTGRLWGKTGTDNADSEGLQLAWFVGAVTHGKVTTSLAARARGRDLVGPDLRRRIARLVRDGVL